MSIQEFGALGEGIGSLLILITLIYLAIQNRYQQKLLLSQSYQARTDSSLSFFNGIATNQVLADIIAKTEQNEELTACEAIQHRSHLISAMKNMENVHYQFQLGVIPEEYWESARRTMTASLRKHSSRQVWVLTDAYFRTSFVAQVNNIIQEIELEEATA